MKKSSLALLVLVSLMLLILSGCSSSTDSETQKIESIDDLKGQTIGIISGTVHDQYASAAIEDMEAFYVDGPSDLVTALNNGKIAAFVDDEPSAKYIIKRNPDFRILTTLESYDYGFIFNKDSEKCKKICEEFNEFIATIKADGTYQEIEDLWFSTDEDAKRIDYSKVNACTGETLTFATSSSMGEPFSYIVDGEKQGLDVSIAVLFCETYNYKIKITDYTFSGMLVAVQTGKEDFGSACITINEERAEKILFSNPYYNGGSVVVVSDKVVTGDSSTSFISSIKESFTNTFIKEDRWKMLAEGVENTMTITVLSIICGLVAGFLIFVISFNTGKIYNTIVKVCTFIIDGMPEVVLLMIFFYIVFNKSDISGIAVSTIVFSIIFAANVFETFKSYTDNIEKVQYEAACALGFSRMQTFMKVIIPQSLQNVIESLKGSVVSLIKATAVVGYVAVQDLTRTSDLIRSRTFDAVFSLISTAIIYFILEFILVSIVKSIKFKTNPKNRSEEKILKGIDKNGN